MRINIDSRIGSFSDIEIDDEIPVLQQIISYLDSQNFDTTKAKIVCKGKLINPELTILNLSGISETPRFFVQYISARAIESPRAAVQSQPEVQLQPARIEDRSNRNYEEISISQNSESNREEKLTDIKDQNITKAFLGNSEQSTNHVVDDSQDGDWKLAKLMEEGYEFEDAYAALHEFDGNYDEAEKSLKIKANPEESVSNEEMTLNGEISRDDATILINILKSKDPIIIDMKAKIRNDPSYIWEWIENLKQIQQTEYVRFFTRNAQILVDAIFEDSPNNVEETAQPKEVPKIPKSAPIEGESDSEMSDVSYDSNDSELNEL